MLAWTKQNTTQRAMRTVLEWPQNDATSKTINMVTNKYEPHISMYTIMPAGKYKRKIHFTSEHGKSANVPNRSSVNFDL